MRVDTQQIHRFDALEVLLTAGTERLDAGTIFGEAIDDIDAVLIAEVLRAHGRVTTTIDDRAALAAACALLRSTHAACTAQISLEDAANGLAALEKSYPAYVEAQATRVAYRTLAELLESDRRRTSSAAVLTRQIELLDEDLRRWTILQLTGSESGVLRSTSPPASTLAAPAPFSPLRPERRVQANDHVETLLNPRMQVPIDGPLGAAWQRDWSAVPLHGEQFGDDDLPTTDSFVEALQLHLVATELWCIERTAPPRIWIEDGQLAVTATALRRALSAPVTAAAVNALRQPISSWRVLTTPTLDFAFLEGPDHCALLGPMPFVTNALGDTTPIAAVARFRDHVESLADAYGDPPPHLLEIATRYGRLRRRSR